MFKIILVTLAFGLTTDAFAQKSGVAKSCGSDAQTVQELKETIKQLQAKVELLTPKFKVHVPTNGTAFENEDAALAMKARLENIFRALDCTVEGKVINKHYYVNADRSLLVMDATCPKNHTVQLVDDGGWIAKGGTADEPTIITTYIHVLVDGVRR